MGLSVIREDLRAHTEPAETGHNGRAGRGSLLSCLFAGQPGLSSVDRRENRVFLQREMLSRFYAEKGIVKSFPEERIESFITGEK